MRTPELLLPDATFAVMEKNFINYVMMMMVMMMMMMMMMNYFAEWLTEEILLNLFFSQHHHWTFWPSQFSESESRLFLIKFLSSDHRFTTPQVTDVMHWCENLQSHFPLTISVMFSIYHFSLVYIFIIIKCLLQKCLLKCVQKLRAQSYKKKKRYFKTSFWKYNCRKWEYSLCCYLSI